MCIILLSIHICDQKRQTFIDYIKFLSEELSDEESKHAKKLAFLKNEDKIL